jgi:hypothetical protein
VGDRSDRDDPLSIDLDDVWHVNHRSDTSWEGNIQRCGTKSSGSYLVKVRGVLERSILPIQLFHPPNSSSKP